MFSLGAVLYELLAGRRAFQGDSAVETLTAILKQEPPELPALRPELPAALDRVVRRCLEKQPAERFQSARDIAFALEALGTEPALSPAPSSAAWRRWKPLLAGAAAAALLAAAALGAGLWMPRSARETPLFRRITFRPGTVSSARFADGQTIVYSAAWEGGPYELFLTREGSTESRPLGLTQARMLSISRAGDMAILLGPQSVFRGRGMLARAPLAGGAPRELLKDVYEADWAPDGSELAVMRDAGGKVQVDFPAGKKLHEAGSIGSLRVSPAGDRIAFFEGPFVGGVDLVLLDRSGRRTVLSKGWQAAFGLAWSPRGDEVWFTATRGDVAPALRAVSLSGRERLLARAPDWLLLQDVHPDGRVLLTRHTGRTGILCLPPGESKERELGWLDGSTLEALSPDGRTVVFGETRAGGAGGGGVYLRRTDGSPAIRLGDGHPEALSPDGKWVLARVMTPSQHWILLPTGPGSPRTLSAGALTSLSEAEWLPDGRRIAFTGAEEGKGARIYVQDVEGGRMRPISPEGVSTDGHTPDGGTSVRGWSVAGYRLYPVEGGEPRPLPHLAAQDSVLQFTADGGGLFVRRGQGWPVEVDRLDLATGRRSPWKTLVPSDRVGLEFDPFGPIILTPDGKSYCFGYSRTLSELYLVEGLR